MNITSFATRGDIWLDADISAEICALSDTAAILRDRPITFEDCAHVMTAKRVLEQLWQAAISAMADPRATGSTIAQLTEVLSRVRALESRVDDARVADTFGLMHRIRKALAGLDEAETPDQLFARIAEETCDLGFDRVSVSTVDGATWRMRDMVIERDPQLAADMVAASQREPSALDGVLVESDVFTTGRPGLVQDVQNNPRVDRHLVAMSGCTSYAVAPLTAGSKVVGLIHADAFYPRRRLDPNDIAILNLFARGASHALSRVSALQDIASLCQVASGAATVRAGDGADPGVPPLSAREVEVVELMAEGRSNVAIARALSISEGTVKTHITHILRKLDAANRAEAVASWLRR